MDKKAYITKALEALKPNWDLAEGLLILVEKNMLNEEVLDALIQMIESAIKETDNETTKKKLIQAQDIIQKIRDAEIHQKELDDQDIASLEAQIANI